jgi:tetratricopeptide (TPR) repeat protein
MGKRHPRSGRQQDSVSSKNASPIRPRWIDGCLVLAAVVLAMATSAAYWGVTRNGFLSLDDAEYVVGNRHVSDGLSWSGVRWAVTSLDAKNWHPLTWLSHMLDVSLFGMWAGGHHLVSIGFHVLNALLLLWFLRYTTGRLWASAFVAGLFALHPLHVESVAWVAERKDVLSTFFFMATLLAYAWYGRKPGALRYAAVGALLALGLMAKPMLVTVPVLLLLLDYWPLQRLEVSWPSFQRRVFEKLPLVVLSILSSAVTLVAQQGAIAPLDRVPLLIRLTNAVLSYTTYVEQMVWPSDLAVYYAYPGAPQVRPAGLFLVLLVAMTAGALWIGRRHRYVATGWFWYVVTLVPVIGVVQVGGQAHADRYTYVPLVGLFILVAWAVSEVADTRPGLKLPAAVAGVAVLATAAITTRQAVGYWKDDVTLFGHAVEVGERNRVTLGNLGAAIGIRGDVDQGVAVLKEGLELAPGDARLLMSIGSLMLQGDRLDESLEYHRRALAADPTVKEAQAGMAYTLARLHRAAEGLPYARKAVELEPTWAFGYNVLAMVLAEAGSMDESIAAFRRAIELDPHAPQFYSNLAAVYLRRGDLTGAAAAYRRGIAAAPDWRTYDLLGGLEVQRGDLEEAGRCFAQAIAMNPSAASAYVHHALVLQRLGRLDEAAGQLRQALVADPRNPDAHALLQALLKDTR